MQLDSLPLYIVAHNNILRCQVWKAWHQLKKPSTPLSMRTRLGLFIKRSEIMIRWNVLSDYNKIMTVAFYKRGKLITIVAGHADRMTKILNRMKERTS